MAKTIAQYRTALRTISAELKRDLVAPVRIESGLASKDVRKAIKATDIGRALWGRGRRKRSKSNTPSLSIKRKRTRISASAGGIIGGFDVAGMAAMIVVGGTTAAHTIKSTKTGADGRPGVLSFGPGEVASGIVKHPGSTVRSHNAIVNRAMSAAADRLEARLGKLIETTARRALR